MRWWGFKENFDKDVIGAQAIYNVLIESVFGKGSDFYNELYDSGKIFNMSSSYNISRRCAFVEISGEAENPDEVYEKVLEEIERVKKYGIDKESIEIAKKSLYGRFVRKFNDVEEIATSFVSNRFMGGDYFKYGDALLSVTEKKICDILKNGFSKSVLSKIMPAE